MKGKVGDHNYGPGGWWNLDWDLLQVVDAKDPDSHGGGSRSVCEVFWSLGLKWRIEAWLWLFEPCIKHGQLWNVIVNCGL